MPGDSLSPFRAEMVLLSGGVATPIRADQFLQSIELEVVTRGAWRATVTLFDPHGDFLESLVIAAGLERDFTFSFGRGPRFPDENREFTGRIAFYKPQFEPNGVTLQLDLVPRAVLDAVLDRQLRGFQEGQRISDLVSQIATARGWATLASGRSTIEPTVDAVKEPFASNGESDFQFIDKTLRPQARNSGGEGGYLFYVDPGDVVHFHTPNYLSPVAHRFRFIRDGSGDVIRFAPADTSIFGALMGGGNSVFGGLSSFEGAATEVTSTQTDGVDGQGMPVESDGGSRLDLGEGVHAYFDLSTRDPEEMKRLAQDRYDTFRRASFQADMEVWGTHRVNPLEFVDIEYIKRDGRAHYLSGRFQVFKITHTVNNGEWTTAYEMMRGTIQGLPGTQQVSATDVNNPSPAAESGSGVAIAVET
jgi:hypothetical protein